MNIKEKLEEMLWSYERDQYRQPNGIIMHYSAWYTLCEYV